MPRKHKPTFSLVQEKLWLQRSPETFESIKKSVADQVVETFDPSRIPTPAEKNEHVRQITKQIHQMHPFILRKEEHRLGLKWLILIFAAQKRRAWRDLGYTPAAIIRTQKTRSGQNSACKSIGGATFEPSIIDLTFSEDDSELEEGEKLPYSSDHQPRPHLVKKEIQDPRACLSLKGSTPSRVNLVREASIQAVSDRQESTDLRKFLASCEPRMDFLFDRLWHIGVRSNEDIKGLVKWTPRQRRDFFEELDLGIGAPVSELQLTSLEHRFAKESF